MNGGDQERLELPVRYWVLYGLVLLATAAVVASSGWMDAPDRNERPAWPYAVDELTSVGLVFALTFPLLRLAAWLDPRKIGWMWTIGGHLAGMMAFCALHVGGMSLLRMALYPLFGASYRPAADWLVDVALYESRKDALTYLGLLVVIRLLMERRQRQEVRVVPAPPAERPLRIPYREGAALSWIQADEIFWVEAAGNYVEVVLASRILLQRQTLGGMEKLLAKAGFVRVHRSRLVNPARVCAVVGKESGDFTLVMVDGREIAGSRRFRAAVDVLMAHGRAEEAGE